MFVTKKAENDVIKLRSALSDVKFMAKQALVDGEGVSEKTKSFLDDIIKIGNLWESDFKQKEKQYNIDIEILHKLVKPLEANKNKLVR